MKLFLVNDTPENYGISPKIVNTIIVLTILCEIPLFSSESPTKKIFNHKLLIHSPYFCETPPPMTPIGCSAPIQSKALCFWIESL